MRQIRRTVNSESRRRGKKEKEKKWEKRKRKKKKMKKEGKGLCKGFHFWKEGRSSNDSWLLKGFLSGRTAKVILRGLCGKYTFPRNDLSCVIQKAVLLIDRLRLSDFDIEPSFTTLNVFIGANTSFPESKLNFTASIFQVYD